MYTSEMISNGWKILDQQGDEICFIDAETNDESNVYALLSHLNRG